MGLLWFPISGLGIDFGVLLRRRCKGGCYGDFSASLDRIGCVDVASVFLVGCFRLQGLLRFSHE